MEDGRDGLFGIETSTQVRFALNLFSSFYHYYLAGLAQPPEDFGCGSFNSRATRTRLSIVSFVTYGERGLLHPNRIYIPADFNFFNFSKSHPKKRARMQPTAAGPSQLLFLLYVVIIRTTATTTTKVPTHSHRSGAAAPV